MDGDKENRVDPLTFWRTKMYYKLFLCLFILLLLTLPCLSFVEGSPEVLKITKGEGRNIKPALAIDSKGRIWVAWCGDRDGDWDLYARYIGHDGWSSEMVIMDNQWDIADFDMAANEINEIWFVWTTWSGPDTVVREARFYSQGDVRSAYSDTLDVDVIGDPLSEELFTFSFESIGKLFFSRNDNPFLVSRPFIITDLITGESNTVFVPVKGSLAVLEYGPYRIARTGKDSFWLVSMGLWEFLGGIVVDDIIARYLWDGEWDGFCVASGQSIYHLSHAENISFRAMGADRSRRVYLAYAWDDDPSLETNYRLIIKCFDAATADSIGQWSFTDAQVAITDDSDLVGFILNRDRDIFASAC